MYHDLSSWALQGHPAVQFHLYTSAVTRDFGWYACALMVVHHAWLLLMLIFIWKCEAGSIRWVSCIADRACRLIWLINLTETSEIWRHGTLSTLVQVLTCRLSGPKPLPADYQGGDQVVLLSIKPMGTDFSEIWTNILFCQEIQNAVCKTATIFFLAAMCYLSVMTSSVNISVRLISLGVIIVH